MHQHVLASRRCGNGIKVVQVQLDTGIGAGGVLSLWPISDSVSSITSKLRAQTSRGNSASSVSARFLPWRVNRRGPAAVPAV